MLCAALLVSAAAPRFAAQQPPSPAVTPIDSDHDGLNDQLEHALLVRFAPAFLISANDCALLPAEFQPGSPAPVVKADNGTIYGQVFPAAPAANGASSAEIHYYHLWRRDCGAHGHPLDTEHVSVLIQAPPGATAAQDWKAAFWYAAAHEETVCDLSQIARATTLNAVDAGPTIWVSRGKHASYLNPALCHGGCGADRCDAGYQLLPPAIINLGEADSTMNGAQFVLSPAWPLKTKMIASNFPPEALNRLAALPDDAIARVNPGKHPAQGIVAVSNLTSQAIATGGQQTSSGLATAAAATDAALAASQTSTANALSKAARGTRSALAASALKINKALRPSQ